MILNAILIIAIIIAVGYVVFRYYKSLNSDTYELDIESEDDEIINLDYLVKETAYAFSRTLKKTINDDNLSKKEYIKKRQRTVALRKSLTDAAYGDEQAKRIIKNNIKDLIGDEVYGIDEKSINNIINFSDSSKISSQQKTEIVLYMYEKEFGNAGFSQMVSDWKLDEPLNQNGEIYYKVTKKKMNEIYECIISGKEVTDGCVCSLKNKKLTYNDKLEILSQAIFERYDGLGAVDMLIGSGIDGIDAGVSGIPKNGFSIKLKDANLQYSYESIWITYHGRNIHMECMSFGTQKELERTCSNIYRYEALEVLSRSKGAVIGTMMDGSRITVCRPDFADSYCFFLRNFASTPSVEPEKLIKDANSAIPICMMKWMIKGQRTSAITGAQNTGKTTWLKSLVRFIAKYLPIRLEEKSAELNLRYAYPDRQIVAFQETPSMSAQEGLNIQKKTNGAVNIIGEVAEAEQASYVIQTSMVASLFTMFTHHAKTTADLIEAISNNLLECGLYNDKKDAVRMVTKVINVDCHMSNVKGNRHIERITEIIPVFEEQYPSDGQNISDEDKVVVDTPEYYRRVTNPKLYDTVDLVKREILFDENGNVVKNPDGTDAGIFRLVQMPSDAMLKDMMEKMDTEQEKEFRYDLSMMKRLSDGEESKEVDRWIQHVLAS